MPVGEWMEQHLWPHGSNRDVWMIIDGARNRRIHFDIINSHLEYSCLYSGDLPYDLECAAPHLVQLEYNDKSTRELLTRAWGQSWGVILHSTTRMDRLRRHLRTLLLVNDYRGRKLLFRYYDPRVLRVFLPTCMSEELKSVFGPISRFYTENDKADALLSFEWKQNRLVTTDLKVDTVEV